MLELFRPSGGALYHMRARRRERLWRPFADALAVWLDAWTIERDELLLIGPSGGYTLPTAWLQSFAKITAYDIDPLAGWMFARRHRLAECQFHRADVFWKDAKLSVDGLAQVLKKHRGAVLFCDVLGQIPVEGIVSEDQWLSYLGDLRGALSGHVWASYHDLYSVKPLPLATHAAVAMAYALRGNIQGAVNGCCPGGNNIEITDHLLNGEWSHACKKTPLAWSLTPTCLHIIEGVVS